VRSGGRVSLAAEIALAAAALLLRLLLLFDVVKPYRRRVTTTVFAMPVECARDGL